MHMCRSRVTLGQCLHRGPWLLCPGPPWPSCISPVSTLPPDNPQTSCKGSAVSLKQYSSPEDSQRAETTHCALRAQLIHKVFLSPVCLRRLCISLLDHSNQAPQTGKPKQQKLIIMEAGSLRSRNGHNCVLLGPLLAFTGHLSPSYHTVILWYVCVLISPSYPVASGTGLRSLLVTFKQNLIVSLKTLSPKNVKFWGTGLRTTIHEFVGIQLNPQQIEVMLSRVDAQNRASNLGSAISPAGPTWTACTHTTTLGLKTCSLSTLCPGLHPTSLGLYCIIQ